MRRIFYLSGSGFDAMFDRSENQLVLHDVEPTSEDSGLDIIQKQGELPWLWHYLEKTKEWSGPHLTDETGKRYQVIKVDYQRQHIWLFEKNA